MLPMGIWSRYPATAGPPRERSTREVAEAGVPVMPGERVAIRVEALRFEADGTTTIGPPSALSEALTVIASPGFEVPGNLASALRGL